jgi:hypothetical protein
VYSKGEWVGCNKTVLASEVTDTALLPVCAPCKENGRGKIPIVMRSSQNMKDAVLGIVFVTCAKKPRNAGRPFLKYDGDFATAWSSCNKVLP